MDVGLKTRPLFRPPFSFGATRTGNGLRLPCRRHRPAVPHPAAELTSFLLERRSQSTAFESPGCHTRHRGTTPAAILLPGLVMVYVSPNHDSNVECGFGQSVTSLESVTSRFIPVRLRLPPERSFHAPSQLYRPPMAGSREWHDFSRSN